MESHGDGDRSSSHGLWLNCLSIRGILVATDAGKELVPNGST